MNRPGYLDEYLMFWTSRPEIERVWLSIYTPQRGEESAEMLTPESRRRLVDELPSLKERYPALILPQGAVGQFLGDQPITRQLPTGAVFVPAATAAVLVRANLGGAETYGVEQVLEYKLSNTLWFGENLTWLYARDKRTGLAPDIEGGTPPLTSNLRLRWTPKVTRFWSEVYCTLAERQDRLSSLALADRRTGATRSRANIASFFNNGARVRGLVANGILLPTNETVAQVQNRVLGTANSAPMFTAIPGYALCGIRGGMRITERSSVAVDFSNMFDKNYRGISWGIDGPGRSLSLQYRYQF